MQNINSGLRSIPDIVKNLLIINVIFYLAKITLINYGVDLDEWFGLFHWKSAQFKPHQIITSMFMHGGTTHLLFNMFGLWMFGSILEKIWGSKKFLIFYILAGIGGGILYLLFKNFELMKLISEVSPVNFEEIKNTGYDNLQRGKNWTNEVLGNLNYTLNVPAVGASGAIYGLLVAYAMIFPNQKLMLLFIPYPISAKYFVPVIILGDLFFGFSSFNTGIAHFAHLGGALFGFLLLKYWESKGNKVS